MTRTIDTIVRTERHVEGAGFIVRRPFPTARVDHVDPFLLIDELGPIDYAPGAFKGAPDHPHRGFETVTYILSGEGRHEDSAGHRGVIGPGDVQWMTRPQLPRDQARWTRGTQDLPPEVIEQINQVLGETARP